jgi:hypothetical protein
MERKVGWLDSTIAHLVGHLRRHAKISDKPDVPTRASSSRQEQSFPVLLSVQHGLSALWL